MKLKDDPVTSDPRFLHTMSTMRIETIARMKGLSWEMPIKIITTIYIHVLRETIARTYRRPDLELEATLLWKHSTSLETRFEALILHLRRVSRLTGLTMIWSS